MRRPYSIILFLALLFVTSSCDKDVPVRYSFSAGAEGGDTAYDVDLDAETVSIEIGPSSYYIEKTEYHYGYWKMDTEWISTVYYPSYGRITFRVDKNDTGYDRKAVVSGYHRVTGRKYVFKINQSR